MECNKCRRDPIDNKDYFFDVRSTLTGKDSLREGEYTDHVLCVNCLRLWLGTTGFEFVKIIRRIENPLYGGPPK